MRIGKAAHPALMEFFRQIGHPALSGADEFTRAFQSLQGGIGMFVGMWMTQELVTVGPAEHLSEIASVMSRRRIRRLPVVEPASGGNRLLGIISHSDVLHAFPLDVNPFSAVAAETLALKGQPADLAIIAADIMCQNPQTTTPQEPIELAARKMRDHKIGALPVVHNEHLVGLITESDVFRAFTSIFESTSPGLRITFDISKGEDIFPLVASMISAHHLKLITFVTLQKHPHPVCVVEVSGNEADALVEDFWKSHHTVISVIKISP